MEWPCRWRRIAFREQRSSHTAAPRFMVAVLILCPRGRLRRKVQIGDFRSSVSSLFLRLAPTLRYCVHSLRCNAVLHSALVRITLVSEARQDKTRQDKTRQDKTRQLIRHSQIAPSKSLDRCIPLCAACHLQSLSLARSHPPSYAACTGPDSLLPAGALHAHIMMPLSPQLAALESCSSDPLRCAVA